MGARVNRRKFMRLAAAGLSSALVPLSGCARQLGQAYGSTHRPTPGEPLTPTPQWYFQSVLGAYEADLKRYRLKIGGVVERGMELSVARMRDEFELVTEKITLSCVGNTPGGSLMSSSVFRGVRLVDVMKRVGVSSKATGAMIFGLDGFISYQSIDDLRRNESMFALDMGLTEDTQAPLKIEHGFPCRIMTPGLYGYMQPKWIDSVNFVDHGGYQSVITKSIPYFEGKIQLASGFSSPRGGVQAPGPMEIFGYAFGDGRRIARVEVSVDDGPYQPTEIVWNKADDELPDYLWALWRFNWDAPVGKHMLKCRAFYPDGSTQFEGQRFPYSGGSIDDMTLRIEEGA
jgi:DMSO/TMAO reductase YedYZ molybdopterin-dependent catalytic subunit